ncbi:MAG: ribosome recycling factor [Planctomycetes bacterium]|nr:ribosome recycling factor [Planctomycetota bacterium]
MDDKTKTILAQFEERATKSVSHLQEVFAGIRTGRASPALVDHIRVEAYGAHSQLAHLAHIQVPEPRQLLIKPFDPSILKAIEKAIQTSDLGLNPSVDGKAIRLTLPPLSQEQRKKLSAKVKDLGEQARVALRNERRDANKAVEHAHGAHQLTDDHFEEAKDTIQEHMKQLEKRIEDLVAKKTVEIMTD